MEFRDSDYHTLDHLRAVEKFLDLINHLAPGPNSCDPDLIHNYSMQALMHLRAAKGNIASGTTTPNEADSKP